MEKYSELKPENIIVTGRVDGDERIENLEIVEYESEIYRNLGSLILDDETVLADHQKEAFEGITEFFSSGGRECYVKLPTGTGKTVLFVELSKKLLEASKEGEKPKILVLVPTVDLVEQTVGSVDEATGKRRGFKGFAPEIDARSHHSNMGNQTKDKNIIESDVLVTTYSTFRNLVKSFSLADSKSHEEWEQNKSETINKRLLETEEKKQLLTNRKDLLTQSYADQEIARCRVDANILKKELLRSGEYLEYIPTIDQIIELTKASGSANEIFKTLKRNVKSHIPIGVDLSKGAMSLEKPKKVLKYDSNIDSLVSVGEKSEALDPFEKFAVKFIRTQYKKVAVKDLFDPSKRTKIHKMTDRIGKLTFNIADSIKMEKLYDRMKIIKSAVGKFELIICDEAHRSIGTETWESIRQYADDKDIAILGLTATDEYFDRSLEDYFEQMAHELTKQEAMKRKIVNPMALFVHNTELNFQNVGLDVSGDYDNNTIRQMRFNDERNNIGIDYAKILSEQGYRGIISAIPGDKGAHAKILSGLINKQFIIDPETGLKRKLRAAFILGDTKDRSDYYEQFESGKLDWLVHIDVLREGWDSDMAKAIINMRPTRSPLLATQRLGRIGRTHDGAPISIAIDLFDGIEGNNESIKIPPVLVADVFELTEESQGVVIGKSEEVLTPVISLLKSKMHYPLVAHHTKYLELLKESIVVNVRGLATNESSSIATGRWQTYQAASKAFGGLLPLDVLKEAVEGDSPSVRTIQGRQNMTMVTLYNMDDLKKIHQDKPEVNPWKLYIDANNQKWITPTGCIELLSKKFPRITEYEISDAISRLEADSGKKFEHTVGRVNVIFGTASNSTTGIVRMFKLDEVIDRLVPYLSA